MSNPLLDEAYKEFDCQPTYEGNWKKNHRKRNEKRETVEKTVLEFNDMIASKSPPKTEAEAVKAIVGGWFAQLLAPLAVAVVKWLSARWTAKG